ncbi:MAG TPA: protein translocase subunit SecF [Myxococcota bacterium]
MAEQKFVTLFDRKTNFDFIKSGSLITKIGLAIAAITVLAIPVLNLNWGIDFAGGTELQVKLGKTTSSQEITDKLQAAGFDKNQAQPYGAPEANEWLIRVERLSTISDADRASLATALTGAFGDGYVPGKASDDEGDRIHITLKVPADVNAADAVAVQAALEAQQKKLAEVVDAQAGLRLRRTRSVDGGEATTKDAILRDEPYEGKVKYLVHLQGVADKVAKSLENEFGTFEVRRVDFVDARVAQDLRTRGVLALGFALMAILIYLAIRFDAFFAPGALVATLHDPLIAMGLFVFLRLEFDTASIAAMLTVVGYSVNGVIVIYDRIRETTPAGVVPHNELVSLVNQAINDTFARSINTVLTTLFTTVAVAIFTDGSIRTFATTMSVGFIIGTISALFVAPTVYLFFRERFYVPPVEGTGANNELTREDRERGVV